VRKAFQQRRKMLTSSLRDLHPHLKEHLEKIGLSPKARPEELSFEEWIQLFKIIS
jgi:16S rRNA A1518/A1519 N6-dimethyltransferase RsmA/KsgA/DIM1 with predicted DNA glycosylase/AP lyase activity